MKGENERFKEANQTLRVMLFTMASISILVGGIGSMNIMRVSVTERTSRIGIRMAVRAKRCQILLQFLIEAVILSLVGRLLGTALSIVSAYGTSDGAGWPWRNVSWNEQALTCAPPFGPMRR